MRLEALALERLEEEPGPCEGREHRERIFVGIGGRARERADSAAGIGHGGNLTERIASPKVTSQEVNYPSAAGATDEGNEMAGLDSMTVRDAIFGLRATRIFRDAPIPEPVLHEVLEAATMACSSGNTQPWEFIVVRDAAAKRAIQKEMKEAFAVIDAERAQTEAQLTDSAGRSVTGRAAVENLHLVPAIVVVCWNPDRGIRMKNEYAENPDGSLRETRDTRNTPLK